MGEFCNGQWAARHMLAVVITCAISLPGLAQEVKTDLAPVHVFGTEPDALEQTFQPKKIRREKLETYQYSDVNRALKQTSGVYVREEDGQGLRPNIGLRGTNPDRSKKIVLLEDGVLIGPAPYSAPAAYYTPSMNHVDGLEVYKGFAATGIGPSSVGGAINYITPEIATAQKTRLKTLGGSFSSWNSSVQTSAPTSFGGYLIQASRLTSGGFKNIDGGAKSSLAQDDLLAKLRFRLPSEDGQTHRLDIKLGYADENSNESYLGLSEDDFYDSPYRRYSSSALDNMQWNHNQFQVAHSLQVGERGLIETTAYRHSFHRVWYRLDRFRNNSISILDVLNNPSNNSLYYDILRGRQDTSALGTNGELVVARNDREYLSQGVQSRLTTSFESFGAIFEPEIFLRYHSDKIERHHTSDRYQMVIGRMVRTADPSQTDAINTDSADAFSTTVQSRIQMGVYTLAPVLRYETVNYRLRDYLDPTRDVRRNDHTWNPGISLLRKFGETFSARVSVNRASMMAGLTSTGQDAKENSTNFETEFAYQNAPRAIEASLTYFRNDYQNITGICAGGEGCQASANDVAYNGGRALITGIEARAAKAWHLGPVTLPFELNATAMRAVFASDFNSTSAEWGSGEIHSGDPLPYIPNVQYSLSAGTEYRRFRQEVTLIYQSKVFDQSAATLRREMPAYGIVDWALNYEIDANLKLTARVDNALGREYAVANRPFGYRPGKPRAVNFGLVYTF